ANDAVADPSLAIDLRSFDRGAEFDERADDLLEAAADDAAKAALHLGADEAFIGRDQAIVGIEQGEAAVHRIDRRQQPLLGELDRADVGPDADITAVGGAPLADAHPPPSTPLDLDRGFGRIAMPFHALGDPGLAIDIGAPGPAAAVIGEGAQDLLERVANDIVPEDLARAFVDERFVVQNDAVVGVEQAEAVLHDV